MSKLNTLASRIEFALKQKDIKPSKASLMMGWSVSTLGKIINDKSKTLRFSNGIKLAEFLGVDPVWLATGKPSSEIVLVKNGKKRSIIDSPDSPILARYVPLLTWQEAGAKIKSSHDIKDKKSWPMISISYNASFATFALMMDGDSMQDVTGKYLSFQTGDILFFDPEERPYLGCYVIAYKQGDKTAIFRRLDIDCGKVCLMPHKSNWPAIELKDNIKIFGVLVERSTRFDHTFNPAKMVKKVKYLDELV